MINVYLISKESAAGKALIQSFEQVQKANAGTLGVSIHATILNDDHAEPHICVTCAKTG